MATNKPRGHTVRRSRSAHAVAVRKENNPATRYEKNFNVALDRWLAEIVLHEYEDGAQGVEDVRYKLLTTSTGVEEKEGER